MRSRRFCFSFLRLYATCLIAGACCAPAHLQSSGAGLLQASTVPRLVKQQRRAMGTMVDITLWAAPGPTADDAVEAAFGEMLRLEKLMTSWPHPQWPPSDVMRINSHAGDATPVQIASETLRVITLAQELAQRSEGAFDITYAPLRDIWHFDENLEASVPPPAAVEARRALVGFADMDIDTAASSVRLRRAGMRIDLGGIAKGAIVDAAVQTLRSYGFEDFIVQAGGDMYVSGKRDTRPWRVGVRNPRAPDTIIASLCLSNRAFSTAGDYERAFHQEGRLYHHILDPRTGYPADLSQSVTIYAPTALMADALDNAVFVLGPQKGMKLLADYADCEAVIVDADGRMQVTQGLQTRLQAP